MIQIYSIAFFARTSGFQDILKIPKSTYNDPKFKGQNICWPDGLVVELLPTIQATRVQIPMAAVTFFGIHKFNKPNFLLPEFLRFSVAISKKVKFPKPGSFVYYRPAGIRDNLIAILYRNLTHVLPLREVHK